MIYEEYDREPPNPRLGYSLAAQRSSYYPSLEPKYMARIKTYIGGNHWVKVTFDSAEAAERACHYSGKNIHGCIVHAEMYRGTGPQGGDRPLRVEGGMSQIASPNTVSSGTLGLRGASQSSATASSATATAPQPLAPQTLVPRSNMESALLALVLSQVTWTTCPLNPLNHENCTKLLIQIPSPHTRLLQR